MDNGREQGSYHLGFLEFRDSIPIKENQIKKQSEA